ncbi:MAG: tail protein X, partial [Firmicutes bacterium]|nr:tail protein X [Bacillota bacterium]
MKTYKTVQGDMWDSIAYQQLGSEIYAEQLMQVNQQYREIYIFPANMVLQLPEIERTA